MTFLGRKQGVLAGVNLQMHVVPYVVHSVLPLMLCSHNNWGWQGTRTSGQRSWELLKLLLAPPHFTFFLFPFLDMKCKMKMIFHLFSSFLLLPVCPCCLLSFRDGSGWKCWGQIHVDEVQLLTLAGRQKVGQHPHKTLCSLDTNSVWVNSPQLINWSTIAANVCVLKQK